MGYCTRLTSQDDFETVVARVEDELAEEGFGVLSEIDIDEAFAAKLGLEDYPRYRILGACAPPLAKDALDVDADIGTLLPCNVVVRETGDGEVVVSAVDPVTVLDVADDPDLDPLAADVGDRLAAALEAVQAAE
jgi:uncharacterized protein (DUF302 family)